MGTTVGGKRSRWSEGKERLWKRQKKEMIIIRLLTSVSINILLLLLSYWAGCGAELPGFCMSAVINMYNMFTRKRKIAAMAHPCTHRRRFSRIV